MALDAYNNIKNQQKGLVDKYSQDKLDATNKIKTDTGFDAKQKALEGTRTSIYNTERLLKDLPENVKARNAGRLITQAQQNRQTAYEQAPIARQLGDLTRSQQVTQGDIDSINSQIKDALNNTKENFQLNYGMLDKDADREYLDYQNQQNRNYQSQAAAAQNQALLDMLGYGQSSTNQGGSSPMGPTIEANDSISNIISNPNANLGLPKNSSGMTSIIPGVGFSNSINSNADTKPKTNFVNPLFLPKPKTSSGLKSIGGGGLFGI